MRRKENFYAEGYSAVCLIFLHFFPSFLHDLLSVRAAREWALMTSSAIVNRTFASCISYTRNVENSSTCMIGYR